MEAAIELWPSSLGHISTRLAAKTYLVLTDVGALALTVHDSLHSRYYTQPVECVFLPRAMRYSITAGIHTSAI